MYTSMEEEKFVFRKLTLEEIKKKEAIVILLFIHRLYNKEKYKTWNLPVNAVTLNSALMTRDISKEMKFHTVNILNKRATKKHLKNYNLQFDIWNLINQFYNKIISQCLIYY